MIDPVVTGPATLYHYTSAAGLLDIVQSRVLWATDAEFMNDAQELRFGRPELRAALIAAADKLSPPDIGGMESLESNRATIMRSAADHLKPGGLFLAKQAHSAHVACFCGNGDLLSQWRGYGSAGGFAIGFRTLSLRAVEQPDWKNPLDGIEAVPDALEPAPEPVRLVKVSYGDEAIQPVIDYVLERIAPGAVGHPGVQGFHRAKTVVLPALATIKHAAFSEEQEWRLIVMASTGEVAVHFRTGPLGVTPYVQLGFSDAAITDVLVGPSAEPALRARGVERVLSEHGLHDVEVRLSEAPFRG